MTQQQGETVYTLKLECTSDKEACSSPLKTISFPSPPCTIGEIQTKIEKDLHIPAALQTVQVGSVTLDSTTELNKLRLRNYDTITVKYFATAECSGVDDCIGWFKLLVNTLNTYGVPQKTSELPSLEVQQLLDMIAQEEQFIIDLGFQLFLPWMKPEKYANKLYFIDKNGLDVMMELYSLLLSVPWHQLPMKLQIVQYLLLCALWNLAETCPLRREILKHGGLEKCVRSLVQVRVEPEMFTEINRYCSVERQQLLVLYETIGAALGTLSK